MNKVDLQNLDNAAFVENNGKIVRLLNILNYDYHKLAEMQRVLKTQGVDEAGLVESVNFLARAGYIELRDIASRVNANLADWQHYELEAILSDKGIRLVKGGIKDNLVEV
jgi:hypothetical protein